MRPHFVRPLPTTVPIQHVFSGLLNSAFGVLRLRSQPAERGALAVKTGLAFYDFLSRQAPHHAAACVPWPARRPAALWPDLPPSVRFSATYHDAWISHPERLGIELILDGLAANADALAINHLDATRREGGRIVLADALTGEEFAVTADLIVNATGAWLDETNAALAADGERPAPFVGGTKGSHLVLDHPGLLRALNGHMIYFENVDGRVCILFPYLGRVLLGSTDIRVDKPGDVRCEDDEVDYILKSLSYVFPGIAVRPEDIVYRYSGVRPLPRSEASFTGRISRDHFVAEIDGQSADALPRRRQVDDVPRLRRAGGRPGAGDPRHAAEDRHRGPADRRRRRLPGRRGRARGAASPGSPRSSACRRSAPPTRSRHYGTNAPRGPRLLPRPAPTPPSPAPATPRPNSATSSGTSMPARSATSSSAARRSRSPAASPRRPSPGPRPSSPRNSAGRERRPPTRSVRSAPALPAITV